MVLFKRRVTKIEKVNNNEINKLWNLIEERQKQDLRNGKYSFFSNVYAQNLLRNAYQNNQYETLKQLYDIVDNWDDVNNLPLECGMYLENMCTDPRSVVAIHRTNLGDFNYDYGVPVNDNLLGILQLGLQNVGHTNVGADVGVPNPSLTTSPLASFSGFINLFASYKGNNTTIVCKFPSQYVDDDATLKNPKFAKYIYDFRNGIAFIKPEFIEFVIIKNPEGLDYYYSADEIMETLRRQVP